MKDKLPEGYETLYCEFLKKLDDKKYRYRAYDNCRDAFKDYVCDKIDDDKMALHLYSFLACWGMATRGQYLMEHNYTCLIGVAQALKANYKENCPFCNDFCPTKAEGEKEEYIKFLIGDEDSEKDKGIAEAIRSAFGKEENDVEENACTQLIISKLLMATYGCIMACDSYTKDAWKKLGHKWSTTIFESKRFLGEYYDYLADNADALNALQNETDNGYKFTYSVSKKLDMILWKYGEKINELRKAAKEQAGKE